MYGSEERGSYKVYPKCSFLSDYLASKEEAVEQVTTAETLIDMIEKYVAQKILLSELEKGEKRREE